MIGNKNIHMEIVLSFNVSERTKYYCIFVCAGSILYCHKCPDCTMFIVLLNMKKHPIKCCMSLMICIVFCFFFIAYKYSGT